MGINGKILELNEEQRRVLVDAQQLWEAFLILRQEELSCRGGMCWKRVRGKEYLVRLLDSRGNMKSLGPRSPETEQIYATWRRKKEDLRQRKEDFFERADLIRKMCKALNLNRVPLVVARIAREMFMVREIRKRIVLLGTNALYAYEALAGVLISSGLPSAVSKIPPSAVSEIPIATGDPDILWDARSCLQIAGLPKGGFLGLLKRADPSFQMGDTPYRAVNREGFWVELLKPTPKSLPEIKASQMRVSPFPEDLLALETRGTRWIVSCPKICVTAVGYDGLPVPLIVPDPRAFVLHKLWVARQPDRPAVKKRRDAAQALLVYHLLEQYLPGFPLNYNIIDRELRALPSRLRKLTESLKSIKSTEDARSLIRTSLPSLET